MLFVYACSVQHPKVIVQLYFSLTFLQPLSLPLCLRGMVGSVVISQEPAATSQPVIFNPDFFVERLRHECGQVFTELVLSNVTRLIDLPGDEFAQLTGDAYPRLPSHTGFLRSLNFLRRKGKHTGILVDMGEESPSPTTKIKLAV